MMKSDYIIYALLMIVIAGLVYYAADLLKYNTRAEIDTSLKSANLKTITTGSTENGGVQVDLKPLGVQEGKFTVEIAINTHSVELSGFDLKKIVWLEYGMKKTQPLSAPVLSGHHNSGYLVFDLSENIQKFRVVIAGIPSVDERTYSWN